MNIERQRDFGGAVLAVTGAPAEVAARAEAVPAAEVLVGLAGHTRQPEPATPVSAPLRRALRRVGPDSSEVWLHLLGLAVEAPAPRNGSALLATVDATAPDELLRHALGYHVPAWRAYVDGEVIAAAAAGDRAAQRALLAHPRYYAGAARATLTRLLRLGADGAADVLRAALRRWYEEVAAPAEERVTAVLDRAAARARAALAAERSALDAVEEVTGGYRHTPEPGIDAVLLLPQLALRPYLLLCQHRAERLCCYAVRDEDLHPSTSDLTGTLMRVLAALHDEQRLQIVTALATGPATLHGLADRLGLAKSTVHHHMGRLRLGGLVTLTRNPDRSYSYALRPAGFAAIPGLLDRLTDPGAR